MPSDEVCRPRLPDARQLLPYLESIDSSRWYSNWGDLSLTLARRLSELFGLPAHGCVVASNATDALTASLIAVAGRATPRRPYCFMPSYTFVATAAAVQNAGYTPYFVDVEPGTFTMTPDAVAAHREVSKAGAVVAVAPYGREIDMGAWHRFGESTGLPVVVDAAAGFDAFASGAMTVVPNVPVVLSFHATKVYGTGEGGAILCADITLSERCHRALNFGFWGSREAHVPGINGKMSEYHAAVGLAELDGWDAKRAAYMKVARLYASGAARRGLCDRILAQTDWASSYVLYVAPSPAACARAVDDLRAFGLGFRFWYGRGVHREPAYAHLPADPMPATEDMALRILGLPVWIDLEEATIANVISALPAA